MKPVNFDYTAPESLQEAIQLLTSANGEARIIAGGQSLLPLLNMRLARPSLLVDLGRIPGLDRVEVKGGQLRIGAMTRHAVVETHALIRQHAPLLAAATALVGHQQIRNRGTIGGSAVHADPAAEVPLALLALDAELVAEGPGGQVTWPASQFFAGPMMTALAEGLVLVNIGVPIQGTDEGWAFQEVSPRAGDRAMAAVAVWLRREDGVCREVRIALGGVSHKPVRAVTVENGLRGQAWAPGLLTQVSALLDEDIDPPSDVHAPAAYRRAVVRELMGRALTEAWKRANSGS